MQPPLPKHAHSLRPRSAASTIAPSLEACVSLFRIHTPVLAWLLLLAAASSEPASARDFFIDPTAGTATDAGAGSAESPWLSLAPANLRNFEPGDRLLLAGGSTVAGTLTLSAEDSGSAAAPVVISSYGRGVAEISGGAGTGIVVTQGSHLEIRGLKVTGLGRKTGSHSDGVSFSNSSHLLIDNLDIGGFQHTGLAFTDCSHVRVLRVNAHDNGNAGIMTYGTAWNDPSRYQADWYFGFCRADNNPGDPTALTNHSGNGILLGQVVDAVVEYCEASNNGWDMPNQNVNGPAGIWAWQSDRVTIQHCISHDNKTVAGKVDGDGFDFDGGVRDSVIQYCLSYNNDGMGYLLFQGGWATTWSNNTVRYCISVDDAATNFFASMLVWHDSGVMNGVSVYNNTFYNSRAGGSALRFAHGVPNGRFANNVFISREAPVLGTAVSQSALLNNLYWRLDAPYSMDGYTSLASWAAALHQETLAGNVVGVAADPLHEHPRLPVGLANPEDLVYWDDWSLQEASPCLGQGLDLAALWSIDTGTRDFTGQPNATSGRFSIGALTLAPPPKSRLLNVSTRAFIGSGTEALIGGFVITGTSPKTVLVRAAGPALGAFLDPSTLLADPVLGLHQRIGESDTVVASNDDWSSVPAERRAILEATGRAGAFSWEEGSKDAALIATLHPGAYTAVVEGKSGASGLGLVEVYEVGVDVASTRLINLSTRSAVHAGNGVQIAGFVVASASPKRVLIRAAGPALGAFLPPESLLADPTLTLFRAGPGGNIEVAANNDWSADPSAATDIAAAASTVGAFPWSAASRDAALLLTLESGAYTAVVSGANGTSGVALVEVYEAD